MRQSTDASRRSHVEIKTNKTFAVKQKLAPKAIASRQTNNHYIINVKQPHVQQTTKVKLPKLPIVVHKNLRKLQLIFIAICLSGINRNSKALAMVNALTA